MQKHMLALEGLQCGWESGFRVDVCSDPLQPLRQCLALSCSCTSQGFACVHLQLHSDIKMRGEQAVPVFSFSCSIIPVILAAAEDASVTCGVYAGGSWPERAMLRT